MLDKDKLIIVAILGVKDTPLEAQYQLYVNVDEILYKKFDSSVKHLIGFDKTKLGVDFKTLNTDKMEPEALQKLIDSLQEETKKHFNSENNGK